MKSEFFKGEIKLAPTLNKSYSKARFVACPFRFKSDDGNTRMSDVMAKYWNMDDKQLKPFNTGCYSNESCKKQENA